MRVALLCYRGNMYCGGQGVYTYYLSQGLARLGHEVHVLAGPPYPDVDAAAGVRLHKLPCHNYYEAQNIRYLAPPDKSPLEVLKPLNLYEYAGARIGWFGEMGSFGWRAFDWLRAHRQLDFDVVHDNQSLGYGLWAIQAGLGLPVVATIHHPIPLDMRATFRQAGDWWGKLGTVLFHGEPALMHGPISRRVRRVITDSQRAGEAIHDVHGVAKHRLRVVYLGIETDIYRNVHAGAPEARDPREILFVGRVVDRKKGVRYLLEALALLKDRALCLTIVDVESFVDDWAQLLIRERGLEGQVRWTGRLTTQELVAAYARAGIVVAPSLFEGFGLTAAEAMACEAPVIATTAGALPEVVADGETGLLVPPRDPAALAAALERLLDDPALRQRLGQAGRQRVLDRFTWRRAAERTARVYEEVVG